ncbi:penicillin-binding transpeptidase domain-containing protein [Paenibacillus sp. M1]|uniref:Penicillin-binding transpeptidase domain-containing protein n=1 Tax=Paenibacillus haidiansis TaxID=1574488 RepID=A0ABU7VZ18_9BACL
MSLLNKKRIFIILLAFSIVLGGFALRLSWIQWSSAWLPVTAARKTMNEMAVRQREEGIELDSGRGGFTDRNGEALTGFTRWEPTLFPVSKLPDQAHLKKMAELLGTSTGKLSSTWSGLKQPYVWTNGAGAALLKQGAWPKVDGFEMLPVMKRYPGGMRGNQWLGYVAQRPDVVRKLKAGGTPYPLPLSLQIGASGLEKTLDRFLRGTGGTRVYYTVDGKKRPLTEIGTRVQGPANPYYPVQVVTTVDNGIQQKLERLVDRMQIKEGSVVVLDARQGDVIAMVSRPFYDPSRIDLDSGNWSNRAAKAAVPGSIFKIVIAAAALEEKVTRPGEVFHCSGHYGKYGLACWNKAGHGDITLEEGFAKSCNVVFATLGERLSPESIARTAAKLGLNRKIGWSESAFMGGEDLAQIDQEEKGGVFGPKTAIDGGVLAQTALGQRDVLITPLQAANLIVTLLHDGQVASPRLASSIRFKDGSEMAVFPAHTIHAPEGRISARTARLLLGWMREVVTRGTGRSLTAAAWPLAGKSGTAQTLVNGRERNNQWFIGYGPLGSPKYAVAVLVQNRPAGSEHQAIALFRKTMDMLAGQEAKS